MSENNGNTIISFVVGFILGGIIGAVTALILAPQSGEETRMLIRDKSIELKDLASTTASDLSKAGQEKAAELQKRGQLILEEEKAKFTSGSSVTEEVEVVEEVIITEDVDESPIEDASE